MGELLSKVLKSYKQFKLIFFISMTFIDDVEVDVVPFDDDGVVFGSP